MRVLVEALGIDRPGGGRSATINLLNGLVEADTESNHEFIALLSRREHSSTVHPRLRQIILPVRNRMLARIYCEFAMPFLTGLLRPGLLHHAKNLVTAVGPAKRIATLYDLTILAHPELYPRTDVLYWRSIEPRMLRALDQVIAISGTTADDLAKHYGLGADLVRVVYPGIDPMYSPGDPDPRVLESSGVRGEYVLHVGSISRKKNLLPLVRATSLLRSRGWPGRLVLVGRIYDKGQDDELMRELGGLRETGAVVMTGPLSDSDLVSVYRAARVFVFPSLHEGFGLVPVEAMACGVPVVSSSGGALSETVGGAASLLNDSSDEREIADCVQALMRDGAQRERHVEAGLARAGQFSRRSVGARTLEVYQSVLRR